MRLRVSRGCWFIDNVLAFTWVRVVGGAGWLMGMVCFVVVVVLLVWLMVRWRVAEVRPRSSVMVSSMGMSAFGVATAFFAGLVMVIAGG